MAESEKTKQLAESVEIVESHGKLTVSVDKKSRNFWGLGDSGLHALSIELALPKTANVKVKTVSGDIATHTFSACDYTLKNASGDFNLVRN